MRASSEAVGAGDLAGIGDNCLGHAGAIGFEGSGEAGFDHAGETDLEWLYWGDTSLGVIALRLNDVAGE